MADNIVTIDLGNGSFIDQLGDMATYTGSFSVDYTTETVISGNFSVTMPSGNGSTTQGMTFGSSALGQGGNDTYTANNGGNTPGFQIKYTGRTPSVADVQFFQNGRTYDTANNPAGQQTPPVSSTVTSGAVCFATGTLIRVAHSNVETEETVENLRIGDICITMSGAHRAIRWIGHRAYAGRFANANPDLLPICIKAGAIVDGVPSRDLYVSPKHALFLDGVLIPAAALVNGVSVVKIERVDELTYWHVELEGHDVIFAENTPAESFVNDAGRGIFHNARSFQDLYPETVEGEARYCAPRLESGHVVAAAHHRIAERAGLSDVSAAPFGELRGHIDTALGTVVTGWARDMLYPDAPVCLDIVVDGELVALAYADSHRPDLEAAGIGDGCHGFRVVLPLALNAGSTVEIRRAADGSPLEGSPRAVGVEVLAA